MTKKFDDFTAALETLCIAHGVRLYGGDDYDDYGMCLAEASEASPAGLEVEIVDCIPLTDEERAAEEIRRAAELERYAAERAEWEARNLADRAAQAQRQAERLASPEYLALSEKVRALADQSRIEQMRISTDPTDPHYIDARPRRVWINNVEVLNWIVADEFRRCVIAPGKHEGDTVVMHGAVLIERLGEPGAPVTEAPAEASTSLSGMFVKVPDVAQVAPEPTFAVPTVPVKAAAMSAKAAKKSKRSR